MAVAGDLVEKHKHTTSYDVDARDYTNVEYGVKYRIKYSGINDIILFPVHKNEIQIPKLTPCNYLIKANKGKQQE
jgi:hypothetical protein